MSSREVRDSYGKVTHRIDSSGNVREKFVGTAPTSMGYAKNMAVLMLTMVTVNLTVCFNEMMTSLNYQEKPKFEFSWGCFIAILLIAFFLFMRGC